MRHISVGRIRLGLATLVFLLLVACSGTGAGSSGSGDWYYHFACNGDSQCLNLNPTGQSSGNLDEGPSEASCTALMNFAARNWGPAAFNACDQSPAFPLHLLSLVVSPSGSSLGLGATRQFQAIAHYNDGSYRDVTAQAVWSIPSGGGYATIGSGGLVTAVAQGTATVMAAMGVVSGSTTVTVGAATVQTIAVTPANPSVASGTTQQFTATAHYSDGTTSNLTSQCSWSSATQSAATIAPGGLSSAVGPGSSLITATYGGVSGNTTLTVTGPALVSIAVAPANPTTAQPFGVRFRAIGTFTDGTAQDLTTQVAWTSGTSSVATVDATGLSSTVAAGSSLIRAAAGAISGQTTLTVTAATLTSISVAPATPTIGVGATVPFAATGHFSDGTARLLSAGITWTSGTPSVATVDPTGLATGLAVGTSMVSAGVGGITGSSLLTVATTPPGASWAYLTTSPAVTCTACATVTEALSSIVWSGTQFVAVGLSGAIVTSPDGLTWTTRVAGSSYGQPSYGPLLSVTWAPSLGRFVAVGIGNIMTSSDGIAWAPNTSGAISNDGLYGVVWSGTQFVAVGDVYGSSTPAILTSPDGLTWTTRSVSAAGMLRGVAWSGSVFVAVGDVTLISADGIAWARVADTTTRWNGIAWSGAEFVAVGDVPVPGGSNGKVRTSADGLAWADRAITSPPLYRVAWTGMQFVAVGGGNGGTPAYGLGGAQGSPGCLSTSPDGITWTAQSVSAAGTIYGTTYTIYGVAWSGTRLVAVGSGIYDYFVYTSP